MLTGTLYNPYEVSTAAESGYFDGCTSLNQQRCAMGDLSGKLGTLRLDPPTANPHKTYSFYDENLHLLGPFTSECLSAILQPVFIHVALCISINDYATLYAIRADCCLYYCNFHCL